MRGTQKKVGNSRQQNDRRPFNVLFYVPLLPELFKISSATCFAHRSVLNQPTWVLYWCKRKRVRIDLFKLICKQTLMRSPCRQAQRKLGNRRTLGACFQQISGIKREFRSCARKQRKLNQNLKSSDGEIQAVPFSMFSLLLLLVYCIHLIYNIM